MIVKFANEIVEMTSNLTYYKVKIYNCVRLNKLTVTLQYTNKSFFEESDQVEIN